MQTRVVADAGVPAPRIHIFYHTFDDGSFVIIVELNLRSVLNVAENTYASEMQIQALCRGKHK